MIVILKISLYQPFLHMEHFTASATETTVLYVLYHM